MSIYIEGMEMPKEIEPALVIDFAEDPDGNRYARFYHYRYGGLTDWHEIIEVPEPHGRLIDADAALKNIKPIKPEDRRRGCTLETTKRLMMSLIDGAPTVIPASEEAE